MLGGEIKKTRLCFLHFLLTAWVSSLAAAVLYFSAPLSTSLSKRYGCRSVTIAGTFICILGMVLSSFYRSLYYLHVTHGVIWGLGQAMCYFSSFLIISQHFETRYSLAIGIAVCGASVGTLVLSPGTDWLFRRFGLACRFGFLEQLTWFLFHVGWFSVLLSMVPAFLWRGLNTSTGKFAKTVLSSCTWFP